MMSPSPISRLVRAVLCWLWVGAYAPMNCEAQTEDWGALGYNLEVVVHVSHDAGILAGMTTYRVYMNCASATDYLSSCSGDASSPLVMNTTSPEGWFNSPFNAGPFAQGVNPLFFGAFPELAFDSFLTLGAVDSSSPPAEHPSSIWGSIDLTAQFTGDGAGQSTTVNDSLGGAWYIPYPGIALAGSHVAFAGEDLRILVAQITTAGLLSGQIQCQIFREGVQSNEIREVFPMTGVVVMEAVGGCTDPEAPNFDPEAEEDDGSCIYACGEGTVYSDATGKCELTAWLGEVGDTGNLDPCHLDLNGSGWMDISDLYRVLVVMGGSAPTPEGPCGIAVSYDVDLDMCSPALPTTGDGNGWGNLNPRFFDLNGDGNLNVTDFLGLLDSFGKACAG